MDQNHTANFTPLSAPAPGTSSHDQAFIEHVNFGEYHPVILFGTQLSGKTALLLSILSYVKHRPGLNAQVNFAADSATGLFPTSYVPSNPGVPQTAEEIFKAARQLFDDEVPKFNVGYLPQSTQTSQPIFIPISLTKGNKYTRFLFVEGNGEWYSRKDSVYRPLVNEINWLLNSYDRPLSIVFVVPATAKNLKKRPNDPVDYNQMLSNVGHCIELYSNFQPKRRKDRLLLVGTQWDTLTNSVLGGGSSGPVEISADDFVQVAKNWGAVWAGFDNLQAGVGTRAAMPYSIGPVVEGSDAKAPVLSPNLYSKSSAFNQFPRIFWNWLYGNASEGSTGTRKALFEDVDVTGGSGPQFLLEWLYNFYNVR